MIAEQQSTSDTFLEKKRDRSDLFRASGALALASAGESDSAPSSITSLLLRCNSAREPAALEDARISRPW